MATCTRSCAAGSLAPASAQFLFAELSDALRSMHRRARRALAPPRPLTPPRQRVRRSASAPRPHRTSRACRPRVPLIHALTHRPTHTHHTHTPPPPPPPPTPAASASPSVISSPRTSTHRIGPRQLTDFGAARPLPGHAAATAALASAGVILELRDGDWRAKQQATWLGLG